MFVKNKQQAVIKEILLQQHTKSEIIQTNHMKILHILYHCNGIEINKLLIGSERNA